MKTTKKKNTDSGHGIFEQKSEFCKSNNINLIRIKFNDNIKSKLIECLL